LCVSHNDLLQTHPIGRELLQMWCDVVAWELRDVLPNVPASVTA
jgi:hypothetical protein